MRLMRLISFVIVLITVYVAPADAHYGRAIAQHNLGSIADQGRLPPPLCIPLRCPVCGEYISCINEACGCTRKNRFDEKKSEKKSEKEKPENKGQGTIDCPLHLLNLVKGSYDF